MLTTISRDSTTDRKDPGSLSIPNIIPTALEKRPFILVSNRGPVEYRFGADGQLRAQRGSGGVVTALAGLARSIKVTWIAAAMTDADRRVAAEPTRAPHLTTFPPSLTVRMVAMPEKVYQQYYNVISNPLLWFLQHYLLDPTRGPHVDAARRRAWEHGYVTANRAFAKAVRAEVDRCTTPPVIMLQDYQLYLVARMARDLGVEATFQHFVHIPWPAPGYWTFLPSDMRKAILNGLLANDVVGFQTPEYARNFLATCTEYIDGAQVNGDTQTVTLDGHDCRVRTYPISVDVAGLRRTNGGRGVQRYREALRGRFGKKTIVRVDRLEPTKNILAGFHAYELLLQRHPEFVGTVKFVAFLVPTRTRLAEYQRYREEVRTVIERISGRFAQPGWQPIEVFHENNYAQAIAGMSLADVLLVNPIVDGMNLVAKEGPIVNQRDGVLILSEGAGAHNQLGHAALSVAPGDVEGTAEALHEALTMPAEERARRRAELCEAIEKEDLDWWMRRQIEDLADVSPPATPGRLRTLDALGARAIG